MTKSLDFDFPSRELHARGARQPRALAFVAAATSALLLCGLAPTAAATTTTRWVKNNAASPSPGTSCSNAGYSSIQAAVNASSAGDAIKVCPGVFTENVVIGTNQLNVTSTATATATVVKAAASAPIFQITAPGATLRGFTIVPAGFADGDIGVNVAIQGLTKARILENAIMGGRIGVNLGCGGSNSSVAYNTVNGQTEGGINIDTCELYRDNDKNPGTHDNLIHHNIACSATSTGSIALGGNSNNNSIHDNFATSISVFGKVNKVINNTTQLQVVNNGSGNMLNGNTVDPSICSTPSF